MPVSLEIGINNKFYNSTAAGQMLASVTLDGDFREPCDITTPVITIDMSGNEHLILANANYVKIPTFRRSYWITRKVLLTDTLIQISMECDVLATFASPIINTRNYISRAEAQWDQHLVDTLQIGRGSGLQQSTYYTPLRYAKSVSEGTFVLGVVAPSSHAFGSVTYLAMTQAQLLPLINMLMSNASLWTGDIEDIPTDIAMAIINPLQYIVSCEWFPISPVATASYTLTSIGPLKLPSSISCQVLRNSYSTGATDKYYIPIPTHMQYIKDETDYLNSDAYSQFILRFAPYGEITIPASKLLIPFDSQITCVTNTDFVSGLSTLTIYSGEARYDAIAGSVTCKLSMSINLSQVINAGMANTFRNSISGLDGLIGGVTSAAIDFVATGFGLAVEHGDNSPVTAAISGVANAASLSKNELKVSGTQGGGGLGALWTYGEYVTLTNYNVTISEFLDITRFGRPLCKFMSPVECGKGYIQMVKPMLGYGLQGFQGTPGELAKCLGFMQAGFIYE